MVSQKQADLLEIIAWNKTEIPITVQTAEVVDIVDSQVKILFDGDENPSMKNYPFLKSYTPEISERVLLINGIIIGGWRVYDREDI